MTDKPIVEWADINVPDEMMGSKYERVPVVRVDVLKEILGNRIAEFELTGRRFCAWRPMMETAVMNLKADFYFCFVDEKREMTED